MYNSSIEEEYDSNWNKFDSNGLLEEDDDVDECLRDNYDENSNPYEE